MALLIATVVAAYTLLTFLVFAGLLAAACIIPHLPASRGGAATATASDRSTARHALPRCSPPLPMSTQYLSMLAGVLSTSIFTLSPIPMLVRAYRTRDLRSSSPANLVLSNIGNMIHWLYIVNLPFGPIWFLHSFYTLVTGLMLFWYLRYRRAAGARSPLEQGSNTPPVCRSGDLAQATPSSPGPDP